MRSSMETPRCEYFLAIFMTRRKFDWIILARAALSPFFIRRARSSSSSAVRSWSFFMSLRYSRIASIGLSLLLYVTFNNRLGGGKARYGDPIRRTADIIHADGVAELHTVRVAAVLTADADLQIRIRRAAALDAYLHQLHHAVSIYRLERVFRQDPFRKVIRQERTDVVAAESERHLREIVCAVRKELRDLGDLIG